jgi:hypothetical protein
MPITTRYTIAAGSVSDATKWDGGVAVPVGGDAIEIRHSMTMNSAVVTEFPAVGTVPFASIDLGAAGGATPKLTCSGVGALTIRTLAITALEMLLTATASDVTITGSVAAPAVTASTTANAGWSSIGTLVTFGAGSVITCGGAECTGQGLTIGADKTLVCTTINVASGADTMALVSEGNITGNITVSGTSENGALGHFVGTITGNIVATCTLGIAASICGTVVGNISGTSDAATGVDMGVGCDITGNVIGTSRTTWGVNICSGVLKGNVTGTSVSGIGVAVVSTGAVQADTITATSSSNYAFDFDDTATLADGVGAAGIDLTVLRLDGGAAVHIGGGVTMTDDLRIVNLPVGVTPLIV